MGITTALYSSGEWSLHLNNYINMNCLAIFCLVAAVSAEADPYYLGGYGYGLGYAGLGYAGHGYGVLGLHAAGYASVSPSASVNIDGLAPAAVPAVGGLYAGAGRYVANSAGTVHVAKREADPYYAAGYGLGYAGLGYAGLGYAGLGYGIHHAAGYASVSPSASVNIAGLAPAAVPAVGGLYAGAGRYVAN